MSILERVRKVLHITFWCAASGTVAVLLLINLAALRGLAKLREPLVRLRTEHQRQIDQIAEFSSVCLRLEDLAEELTREREQIFSMLEHGRSRDDFVVTRGRRIVAWKHFHDHSQREPAIFFYAPPGTARLRFVIANVESRAAMAKFMFDRELVGKEFQSLDLPAGGVYEIRFFKITPDRPSPAGFQLLGPDSTGRETVLAEHEFAFPSPVAAIGGGYGSSRAYDFPHEIARTSGPAGVVKGRTQIGSQSFLFPDGSGGPDRKGPRAGVRVFLETETPPTPLEQFALDDLFVFMRQPATAEQNVADLFQRAESFKQLLRREQQLVPRAPAPGAVPDLD